jgi:hypothetical protein
MSRGQTINDVVSEIRSLLVEENEVQLSKEIDIIPSLNRAQEKAYQVLSIAYPTPISAKVDFAGLTKQEFTLPENIFADKIRYMYWVDVGTGRRMHKCNQCSDMDVFSDKETIVATPTPDMYVIYGRTIRLVSPPTGSFVLRMWYLREPDPLVTPVCDVDGSDGLTTIYIGNLDSAYELNSSGNSRYVNVIDGQTGLIKGSLQLKSISGETAVIKTTPNRTVVMNRPILTTLAGLSVDAGDYLAPIRGTCVIQFSDMIHTFIVQYTVAEVKRMLGYAYDVDQQLVTAFTVDLRKSYSGRDAGITIKRRNSNWNLGRLR